MSIYYNLYVVYIYHLLKFDQQTIIGKLLLCLKRIIVRTLKKNNSYKCNI